jgi:cell division protein ZapA (FtsZ GTPase activity inhibitor)
LENLLGGDVAVHYRHLDVHENQSECTILALAWLFHGLVEHFDSYLTVLGFSRLDIILAINQ